jgi:hypothetical protein
MPDMRPGGTSNIPGTAHFRMSGQRGAKLRSDQLFMAMALVVAVAGQVLYHTVARTIGSTRSPFELVGAAYLFAFVAVLAIGMCTRQIDFSSTVSTRNLIPALGIGVAVSCVEIGFIFAYRYGLTVNTGALSVVAMTTIALVPIGLLVFGEAITPKLLAGVLVTATGIWLMRS